MNNALEAAESLAAEMSEATWYEARLTCKPDDFYECLARQAPGSVLLYHHFYEPWHKDGPVARLLVNADAKTEVLALLDSWDAVGSVEMWEREDDDRLLYGHRFDAAMTFFGASSLLASERELTIKLVHCVLNAHGFTVAGEIRWGFKFTWNRLTIMPRLWWREIRTGKTWWARADD